MGQNKIVEKGIKLDLHIHSAYSSGKDGEKVKHNTLENLPILVHGLISNEVELCAITDHDMFNYEIYRALKEEEGKDNCIKKVLPGIEFSVEFLEGKVIHIVTIFDDADDEKVKNIERIMLEGDGKTRYKKTIGCYTRGDYFEILNEIGIDFIMIAHQKKTVSSQQKAQNNDVMSLGEEMFNQLVFMDYFDAFEFRNKKNDVYNKAFIEENDLEENLRFITGSDCHDWTVYPKVSKDKNIEFLFTYVKSLPSFKGIAMAITDNSRISLTNKFFNPTECYIDEIIVQIRGKDIGIPLSKGINVIIGDNSVGKSLFLNAITDNYKVPERKIKQGYEKYLLSYGVSILSKIPQEKIFMYNRQGEIRDIFDKTGMKADDYLQQFYPEPISVEKYRRVVDKEFERLFECIAKKFAYDKQVSELTSFEILLEDGEDKGIAFVNEQEKIDIHDLQMLVDDIQSSIDKLKSIEINLTLDEGDKKYLGNAIEMLMLMLKKYNQRLQYTLAENEKINIYTTYMKEYKREYAKRISDEQEIHTDFIEKKNEVIGDIYEAIAYNSRVERFEISIEREKIIPQTNAVDKYRFVSKIGIDEISDEYIKQVLESVFRKDFELDTSVITEEKLRSEIKRYPAEDELPLDVLKQKIEMRLSEDFKIRNSIVEDGMDLNVDLSQGFDAQTYFTLISGETRNKGVYIIDQPEDHISQKAIKDKVLGQFRRMGETRQVIMVTHNPQFIVNLDVDNVIYLEVEGTEFKVKSGALEYEENDYSILKIVADNIEGGLQTILGRMKRYEKNI